MQAGDSQARSGVMGKHAVILVRVLLTVATRSHRYGQHPPFTPKVWPVM